MSELALWLWWMVFDREEVLLLMRLRGYCFLECQRCCWWCPVGLAFVVVFFFSCVLVRFGDVAWLEWDKKENERFDGVGGGRKKKRK